MLRPIRLKLQNMLIWYLINTLDSKGKKCVKFGSFDLLLSSPMLPRARCVDIFVEGESVRKVTWSTVAVSKVRVTGLVISTPSWDFEALSDMKKPLWRTDYFALRPLLPRLSVESKSTRKQTLLTPPSLDKFSATSQGPSTLLVSVYSCVDVE